MVKLLKLLGLLGISALLVGACSSSPSGDGTAEAGDFPQVVVAAYPLEFLAEAVGGDRVVVENVAASAGDAHHLELSPAQVARVGQADLAPYISGGFQPAMEDAIAVTGSNGHDVLLAVDPADLIPGDPHIWLNPLVAADMADALASALSEASPENSDYYQANAQELRGALQEVDEQYAQALAGCGGETLLTSHEAFGYLAQRYGLEQEGVLGLDPDAEPSPRRINEVATLIDDRGITTLFIEPRGTHADGDHEHDTQLSTTLGVQGIELDPLEVQNNGELDFLAVLERNLDALKQGLACASK